MMSSGGGERGEEGRVEAQQQREGGEQSEAMDRAAQDTEKEKEVMMQAVGMQGTDDEEDIGAQYEDDDDDDGDDEGDDGDNEMESDEGDEDNDGDEGETAESQSPTQQHLDTDTKNKLPRIFVVEMPGTINNPNNAVKALGGAATLHKAASDMRETIHLKLRPGDPFSHPILGKRQEDKALLLKVKRRKGGGNRPEDFKIELVGHVEHLYRFTEPADFQFVPGVPAPEQPLFRNQARPEDDVLHPDFFKTDGPTAIVPPAFCVGQPRTAFNFVENPLQDQIKQKQTRKRAARERDIAMKAHATIDFDAPAPERPPSSAVLELLPPEAEQVKQRLIQLFESRPIWSTNALHELIGRNLSWAVRQPLRQLSYRMVSGPWRQLNIKYGYDPRQHQSAYVYQVMDWSKGTKDDRLQLGRSALARMADYLTHRPQASQSKQQAYTPYIYTPGVIPHQRQVNWQLCDMHEPNIQRTLQEAELKATCDRETGWLTEKTVNTIRKLLNESIEQSLRAQQTQEARDTAAPSSSAEPSSQPATVSFSSTAATSAQPTQEPTSSSQPSLVAPADVKGFALLEEEDDDDDDDDEDEDADENDDADDQEEG